MSTYVKFAIAAAAIVVLSAFTVAPDGAVMLSADEATELREVFAEMQAEEQALMGMVAELQKRLAASESKKCI